MTPDKRRQAFDTFGEKLQAIVEEADSIGHVAELHLAMGAARQACEGLLADRQALARLRGMGCTLHVNGAVRRPWL